MGRGGGATWGRELSRARGRLSRPPHLPRSHPFLLATPSWSVGVMAKPSPPGSLPRAPPRHTLCIHVPLCTAFTVLRGGWTVDSQGSGLRLCLRILHPAATERNRPLAALACTGPWASRHGLQQLCPGSLTWWLSRGRSPLWGQEIVGATLDA